MFLTSYINQVCLCPRYFAIPHYVIPNQGLPTLKVDNGIIRDKTLLPILSLAYGPMLYESQSAKVILGPLTCHPPLENERYIIKDHIDSNEKNITVMNFQIIDNKHCNWKKDKL